MKDGAGKGTCGGNQGGKPGKVHFTYSFQKMGKNEIKIKFTSFGVDKKESKVAVVKELRKGEKGSRGKGE